MTSRLTPIILLAVLSIILCLMPVSALSKPAYPPQEYPELVPGLITVSGDLLIVQDPARKSIEIINMVTWESKSLSIGDITDVAASGRILAVAPLGGNLILYDVETGGTKILETTDRVEDLEVGGSLIWATIPLQNLIIGVDPASLEIESRIELDVAYGRNRISVHRDNIWTIMKDDKTITKIDLKTGSRGSLQLDEGITAIRAFESGALVATSGDKILEISGDMKIRKTWSVEKGSTVDMELYRLEDGRIIYVSPSRWVIGEIEGDRITEVKAEARIGGSTLSGDKIWFTELTNKRIGYVPLSRPPRIIQFKVEKIGENMFRAYVEASDPDGDLTKVYLITYYPELIGPAQNRTYEMARENGRYILEFTAEYGRKAEVYASALDAYNNVARSETITIKAEKLETITVQTTTQTTETHQITPADIYAVGSSLLLLIPVILAIFYIRRGRRRKRR